MLCAFLSNIHILYDRRTAKKAHANNRIAFAITLSDIRPDSVNDGNVRIWTTLYDANSIYIKYIKSVLLKMNSFRWRFVSVYPPTDTEMKIEVLSQSRY